jgi:glycine/D-amino acid oxidase-like deaminating enzyme
MSLRCVIVGGGVVGVVAALRLAERGADVTLVDASVPGSGTSGTTFAHVNASYAGYWDYFELRAAGVAGYRRLRAELGSAPWLVDTGFLQFERSPHKHGELSRHADRLREAGYAVARVRPDDVRQRLEPALVIPSDVEEIFFYPDEGYVEVQAMLTHLLRAAGQLGVGVRRNDRVVGFQSAGDRVRGVTLESGERIAADVVVCSCGRWTDAVLALADVDVAVMAPDTGGSIAPGLIAVSSPVGGDLRRVFCADGMNVRPDGGGRLMLWSGDLDARLQAQVASSWPDPSAAQVGELAREAIEVGTCYLPALEGAGIEKAHVCIRSLPRDGLPVVGWVPRVEGLYVLAAHAAVTLAPVLGEVAASEIADLSDDARLARFRPDRFSAAQPSAVAGARQ